MRRFRRLNRFTTASHSGAQKTQSAAGRSTDLVLELCDDAARRLSGEAAAFVRRVRQDLAEPQLRVATMGRVSSGKSVLVNALVGQRIAPTDAGECTQFITRFRYGEEPSAVAWLRDGRRLPLPMPRGEGELPRPPVGIDELAYLDMCVPAERLRDVVILDSPGISSAATAASQLTHELVANRRAALPTADAVAFVLNQEPREDEYALLHEIERSNTLIPASVQTVGVLSKADLVGGGGTSAPQAARNLARTIADRNRALLAAVTPVIGLLAEAGNCGRLAEREALALRHLSRDWVGADRAIALGYPQTFLGRPSTVSPSERRHLMDVIGLAGVRELVERIDEGLISPAALNAACARASGYDDLRIALIANFRDRTDSLKSGRALSTLIRAVYGRLGRELSSEDRRWLENRLESVRFDPRTHRILEFQALHQVLAGQVDLPEPLQADLIRLVRGGDGAADHLGPDAWQNFEASATSAGQREVARVMVRSYAMHPR